MPKRYWLVVGTFLLSMLLYVDRACISSAKGAISEDLGLSETQFSWIFASFAFGYALCQTPAGLLADRFGPRLILAAVVSFWSLFTALTGAAKGFWSMVAVRSLFGAGEAGAFPGCARAVYSWLPMSERGLVQGINFSGSRIGAAVAMPLVALMVDQLGWRPTFLILGGIGFGWAAFWYVWFRDDPTEHPRISSAERELILKTRQEAALPAQQQLAGSAAGQAARAPKLTAGKLFGSVNVWLAMGQYVCSNFTFYFCLSWLFPYLEETYGLTRVEAGIYALFPFVFGALGNWASGAAVDRIYRRGRWRISRRLPAIVGFLFAAAGMASTVYMEHLGLAVGAIFCLSVATFGADMTLSPSWSLCIDIGGRHAGAVSGTMNMAGNLGAAVTMLAFPHLNKWTGSTVPFFLAAAALNLAAVLAWLMIRPDRPLEEY